MGLAILLWCAPSWAGRSDVRLLPTVTPVGALDCAHQRWKRPDSTDDAELSSLARALDAILSESVQDLGFTLDVSRRPGTGHIDVSDAALSRRAAEDWVVSPRLHAGHAVFELRLVAVPPGSRVTLSRVEIVTRADLEVRASMMLRDLMGSTRSGLESREVPATPTGIHAPAERARSTGRAVLALNSAVLGGYIGLSLQRASGSDDARLTYPLMALGAGMGLGASVLIADEWDVGLGDAWYLAAGAWWPAAAGLLLADGYDVEPIEDRYVYGMAGAGAGIALATTVLSYGRMSEGGATLTHSGGALGLLLGGITQAWYEGTTEISENRPTRGMGYGAAIGVAMAGAAASQFEISSSRVLLIDLIAGLGALTGAAAASPLVIGRPTTGQKRAWLASVAMGTVLGGALGFAVTPATAPPRASAWRAVPYAGAVAPPLSDSEPPPVGAGLVGSW